MTGLRLDDSTIDRKVQTGTTLLHVAAEKGHLEILEFLIQNGVNPNSKNNDDETAMHKAARNGFSNIVQFLLENGGDSSIISIFDVFYFSIKHHYN